MTTPAQVTETAYALTGSNLGPFSTAWFYEADSDVVVTVDLGSGPTKLTSGVGYTLTDSGSGSLVGGGSVTLSSSLLVNGAWPANSFLYLTRAVAGGQPSPFGEAAQFSPQVYEQAMDHIARQVQELKALALRVLALRPGETPAVLPDATERALQLLGFDAGGNVVLYPTLGGQLAANSGVIVPGVTVLGMGAVWSAPTVSAPCTCFLPAASSAPEGAWAMVADADGAAGTNNITITAHAGDTINGNGSSGASLVANTNDVIVLILKRNGQWRAITFGF